MPLAHSAARPKKRPTVRSPLAMLEAALRGEVPPSPVAVLLGLELAAAGGARAGLETPRSKAPTCGPGPSYPRTGSTTTSTLGFALSSKRSACSLTTCESSA